VCATTTRIGGGLGYPLNCDSPLFMQLALHPRELLKTDNRRQSRPMYVFIGAALTRSVGRIPLVGAVGQAYGSSNQAYVPLILINLGVLVAAVLIFVWVLLHAAVGDPAVIAGAGGILLANEVVKAFFWTPHTQMFNILVPVLAVAAAYTVLRRRHSTLWFAVTGLTLGLVALAYASIIIAVPAMLVARGWSWARHRSSQRVWAALLDGAAATSSFPLPTMLWILLVRHIVGSYHSEEAAAFAEFVWIPQSLHQGWWALWTTWVSYSVSAGRVIWAVALAPALLLGFLALMARASSCRLAVSPDSGVRDLLIASAIVFAVTLVFLDLLGVYVTRIAFMVVPTLMFVAALVASLIIREKPRVGLVAMAALVLVPVLLFIQLVTSPGPYS
jgi:hypothetical protein